ncbi:hypothetical protein D3C80_968790 [compost metagenome]
MNDLGRQCGLAGPRPVTEDTNGRELHLLALATRRGRAQAGVDHHRCTIAVGPLGTDLGIADFGRGTDTRQLDVFEVRDVVTGWRTEERAPAHRHGLVIDQRGGRVLVMVIDVEQRQFQGLDRPVADLCPPLAAVARIVGPPVIDSAAVGTEDEFPARPGHVGSRQVAAHRRQLGALPLVLVVAADTDLRVEAISRGKLPDRQQHFLDLDPRLRRLDRVGRALHAAHTRVEQAFAPGLDVAPRLDVEHRIVVETPAAEHVGIEELAAATAVVLGVAGELVVGTGLVHRRRRVVVVGLVIDVIVERTAAQYRTVVVLANDHFGQGADAVGDQAALVEVAVAVIAVEGQQLAVLIGQAHTDAVAGGQGPVDGGAVLEFDGFARPGRGANQCDGNRQARNLKALQARASTIFVVLIDHTASPD